MEAKELLKKIVGINSIFPHEEELALFLESYLRNLGFIVQRQYVCEDRFNVLAEKGEGKKSLLFYGHLDTVPVYGDWKTDPFTLSEGGDILYGLGASDMKAGIVSILKAIENKTPKNFKLKVAFGVDEENISEGGHTLVNSEWCKDVVAAVIPETGTTTELSIGSQAIILGRRGRAVYSIKVPGFSVHGAGSGGVNAIEEAAKIVMNVKRISLAKHPKLPPASFFVRAIHADSTSLSIPEKTEIIIDRHLVPPETKESVLRDIKRFIDELYSLGVLREVSGRKIEVEIQKRKTPYLDPYVTDEFNPFVIFVSKFIKEKYGKVVYRYGLSVADENLFGSILKIPTLVIGPKSGNCHSADEWVSYLSILDLTELFSKVIDNFQRYLEDGI